jgi:hypothetical protein
MFLLKTFAVPLGLGLLALAVGPNAGAPADQGRDAVDAWLEGLSKGKAPPVPPKIAAVDAAVRELFPHEHFYTIRYLRYPRAVRPPGPLKLENLVCVHTNGTVDRLENLEALKKLFEKKLPDLRDEVQTRAALVACLRLAEEFYQDGYYTFTIPDSSVSITRHDDHFVASGKTVVTKGGKGEVTVKLTTGSAGKIEIEGKTRADVRLR